MIYFCRKRNIFSSHLISSSLKTFSKLKCFGNDYAGDSGNGLGSSPRSQFLSELFGSQQQRQQQKITFEMEMDVDQSQHTIWVQSYTNIFPRKVTLHWF